MNQEEIQFLLQDAETKYNQAKEDYLASKRDRNARRMQLLPRKEQEPSQS